MSNAKTNKNVETRRDKMCKQRYNGLVMHTCRFDLVLKSFRNEYKQNVFSPNLHRICFPNCYDSIMCIVYLTKK